MLLEAARDRLGAYNILTGYHLDGWEETSTQVIARFIDKRSGDRLPDQEGDLLLGADGIHSTVRQILYPNEGRRYGTAPFSGAARPGQSRS